MTTPLKTRRVFVTGATGYLGVWLIPRLLARGHHITALTRVASAGAVPSGCEVVVGNPLESGTFVEQVRGADTLVHLVGTPKPAPWKGPHFRAVDGPSAMAAIRAAREAGVRHIVYVSVAHPAPVMRDYSHGCARTKKTPQGSGALHGLLLLSRIRFLAQRRLGAFSSSYACACFFFCLFFFFCLCASSGFDVWLQMSNWLPLVQTFLVAAIFEQFLCQPT